MPNTTKIYNLKKPLKNEFVDVNILNENMDILDLNLKSVSEKTNTAVQSVKIGNTEYKNGTEVILPKYPSTPAEVGLGNVPNVSTNNQTPTYTEASNISRLSSGEKLSTAFGKISKAITDLISHLSDVVKHITNTERTNWNNAYKHSTSAHAPSNAEVNQNAFSNIKVGSTVLSSGSKSGTFELLAGNNVTLTPNKSGNKITISSSSSSGGGTDTKATQTNTTNSAKYRVILSTNANDTTETDTLRKSTNFTANPSTGAFYAGGYDKIDISDKTLDMDTITLSSGSPHKVMYIEKTYGGSANITNIPISGLPFILEAELIRWASSSNYITRQTFRNSNHYNEYVRTCNSGTWTSWVQKNSPLIYSSTEPSSDLVNNMIWIK